MNEKEQAVRDAITAQAQYIERRNAGYPMSSSVVIVVEGSFTPERDEPVYTSVWSKLPSGERAENDLVLEVLREAVRNLEGV